MKTKLQLAGFLLLTLLTLVSPKTFADDYFWVGGSGLWSDINHWATTSGGSVLHSQVPTANDDVFFDANSFTDDGQTVIINLKNAVCHDMVWTGASHTPELKGDDTTHLRIFGSLTFIAEMNQKYLGEVMFDAVSGMQEIYSAGHIFKNNVWFRGIGGSWEFKDDFVCAGTVYFNNGTLKTNDFLLDTYSFSSETQTQRVLLLDNSVIHVNDWIVDGTQLEFHALSSAFQIGASLTNKNGGPLAYPDVHFYGNSGTLTNNNLRVLFHDLLFDGSGFISGDCNIHNVHVYDAASIIGTDTIRKVVVDNAAKLIGGRSVIDSLIYHSEGMIQGHNQIGMFISDDWAQINDTNTIDTAICKMGTYIAGVNNIHYLRAARKSYIVGTNDIYRADLLADGYLSGNNRYNYLNFSPGCTYVLGINTVQTVEDEWNITGTCNAPIRIFSDTNGVQAIVKVVNGSVNGDRLSLRDLKAEGNVPFVATNTVDLGNNENWNIQALTGTDLYWVNGSGNWTSNSHWDTHSGGPGGHCPPTELDNVIFDAASFSSGQRWVTLDAENAVCNDMYWDNAVHDPFIEGTDTNNLHIFGSLTISPPVNWMVRGEVYFESVNPGKNIVTGNHWFQNNTLFVGRGGTWDLMDSLKTLKTIVLRQGVLNTRGNNVVCYNFFSSDTTTRGLHLSTTTWQMTGYSMAVWVLNSQNLDFSGDSSLLISEGLSAHIVSIGGPPLVYHNVNFLGSFSQLINQGVYCIFNVIDHKGIMGEFHGNCKIDSALLHNFKSIIFDADSINVAIFDMLDGKIKGNHKVKKAIFRDNGFIEGTNKVDTAIFYRNAQVIDTNVIDTAIVYNTSIIKGNNVFGSCVLLGNGQFYGTNEFDRLTLNKSHSYYLEAGITQTINEKLNAEGTCTGPIFIQSDENMVQAVIKKINGTVEADYLQLRDLKAEGPGVPFKAYNSVDLGNNSGWEIYTSSPKELYWVNGEGNWSDSLHWSGVSGGAGGYCIPTPIDNVYFDQNSFLDEADTVFIDIGNATCHNMDWTGAGLNPAFYSPDSNFLRIYGGLKLNKYMDLALKGPLFFESTHGDNTILTRECRFKSPVSFQGIGGEWLLGDAFHSLDKVYFIHGTFNSRGFPVEVAAFNSNYTNQRALILDNSQITLTGSANEPWYLNGQNIDFSDENTFFYLSGANAIFRTDFGGPFHYTFVNFKYEGWIYNRNTNVSFDSVTFENGGQIHGDCDIGRVRGFGDTQIFDADNIGNVYVAPGAATLNGNHKVGSLVTLTGAGNIIGNNEIDSVYIGWQGHVSGTNKITGMITIGDIAEFEGNNFAHYALLKSNGFISGENEFDTLKFTPGNFYELEQGKTQTVNKDLLIRGNNCFPITLRSQQNGSQAFISMPQGRTVSGDFIEIKDINAGGGAVYYAGRYSTDLTGNSGWIFKNAPGYIFGFGSDTVACLGGDMIIGTDNFNPDDQSTFLWNDGSTLPYYQLSGEDTVWVTVTYAENCSYTDTLAIHYKPSPEVDLGADRTLCSGDTLSVAYHSDSVTFLWSNGSTDTVISVTQTGLYSLTVTNEDGCPASDTVFVTALPAPQVDLGPDTTIFSDQEYLLDAGNPGASHFWSTGDTTQTITVNSEGDYWVAVSRDGCTGYDTVSVFVYPDCILSVPNAFSPNGDGHNDLFYARGEGFTGMELMLFNRVGTMVFQTKDISVGWDGTFKGKPQPVDTYVYMLKGLCVSGRTVFKKGNFTLLR